MSGWAELSGYELRNLPAHLAASGRWAELDDVVFETGFLRAALHRFGVLGLTALLGELADHPGAGSGPRARLTRLLALITGEASFLAAGQYAGYDGPFGNHLAASVARSADDPLAGALWTERADVEQEGWLDPDLRHGRPGPAAVRFFMPGRRESHGWDIYDAGPMGVRTRFGVDARRMRLLGQTTSMYYDQYVGAQPAHYDWRIWDLRTGTLLFERSDGVRIPDGRGSGGDRDGDGADWSVHGRPAAFDDPEVVWSDATREPSAGPLRLDGRPVRLTVGPDDHIYLEEEHPREARDGLPGVPGQPPELPDDGRAPLPWQWDHRERAFRRSFATRAETAPMPVPLDPPAGHHYPAAPPDGSQEMFLAPGGRYVIERRTLSMGVWERPGGRWVGALAAVTEFYGGGGVLRAGCAVTPDGGRIISAHPGRHIRAWNLDDLAARPAPPPHHGRAHLPDWSLDGIELADPVTHLGFLWGGWLVAAVTETHELLVLRCWHSSAVLARIGLDEEVTRLRCEPYGSGIFCVGRSGRIMGYRYRYLPGPGVTTLDGDRLTVRLHRPGARSVAVAGTFTGWRPSALAAGAEDWAGTFPLAPGEHEYKLLVDESEWTLDPHTPFRAGPVGENNYVLDRRTFASAASAM